LGDDAPLFPVQTSAAAPALDPEPILRSQASPVQVPARPQLVRDLTRNPEPAAGPVQASLFGPMEVLKQAPAQTTRNSSPVTRRRQDRSAQGQFDFTHTLPTSVVAALHCEAPVALAAHRAMAAAIDLGIPLVGFAVFLGTFRAIGGSISLDAASLPYYGVALMLITTLYRLLWCLGNCDTAGVQWAGLQLLNFNGQMPTRTERARRLAGGVVSTIALGIGLIWSLVDEEHLTWHDYISNTFLTPKFGD
jgi:uncharacterized RDD family membrane protein YckC